MRRGQEHRTPSNMYVYGMIENGPRGVHVDPIDYMVGASDNDYAAYGIDWDDFHHDRTRSHHDNANPADGDPTNPFITNQPDRLSHVAIPDTRCPFSPEQIQPLDEQMMRLLPYIHSHDMNSRRLVWIDALRVSHSLM